MPHPHEITYPALYAAPESVLPMESEYDANFVVAMDTLVTQQTQEQGSLTLEEETALMGIVLEGRKVQYQMAAVTNKINRLTGQAGQEAARDALMAKREELATAHKASESARRTLLESNLRMVYDLAQTYSHPDRIYIAFCSLTRAIDEYDPDNSRPFGTWAKFLIKRDLTSFTFRHAKRQKANEQEVPPTVVPLAHLTYPYAASEEADASGDASVQPPALHLADMVVDESRPSVENEAARPEGALCTDILAELLHGDRISQVEREVLARRFGILGYKPASLKKVGEILERSSERIRQIENGVMHKLRHPSRSNRLTGFLEETEEYPQHITLTPDGSVRTGRLQATQAPKAAPEPKPDFTVPKYTPELPEGGRLERGTASYQRYGTMFNTRLGSMNSMRYHGTSTTKTPYPKEMLTQIEEDIGAYLTPQHIEDAWNTSMRHLITTASGDLATNTNNPFEVTGTRLCQLFSALLIDRMRNDDHITVEIPPLFWGQWDDIGAWAKRGKITIIGEPGKNVGRSKSESAQIEVTSKGHWRPPGAF